MIYLENSHGNTGNISLQQSDFHLQEKKIIYIFMSFSVPK